MQRFEKNHLILSYLNHATNINIYLITVLSYLHVAVYLITVVAAKVISYPTAIAVKNISHPTAAAAKYIP
jgi:hypothetical protein